jgi:hypothetical protein
LGAGLDAGAMSGGGTGGLLVDDTLAVDSRLLLGNSGRGTGGEGQDGHRGSSEVHFVGWDW